MALENHGGPTATADGLLAIVRDVDSDWFGVNLDTGNFISDDPYEDLEKCAPHAVNVQLKMRMKNRSGETFDADFPRIAKILSGASYRGFVVLEFEESDPYANVPGAMKLMRSAFQ